MNICVIASSYPRKRYYGYSFVEQLVNEFARQGNDCTVIAPLSINKNRGFYKYKEIKYFNNRKNHIIIYRPNIITCSKIHFCGDDFTTHMYQLAVNYVLAHLKTKPDIIYGHFWARALHGYKYAKKNAIPLMVATGESDIGYLFGNRGRQDFFDYISGVVCVSTKNMKESIKLGLTERQKCQVFPNAIDNSLFRKMNKNECRSKLGLPKDKFIVAFVGSFVNRKGPNRIIEALEVLQDDDIKLLLIGNGNMPLHYKGTLLKKGILHDELPYYLSASDVFVLPTLNEGCCNAIIEAMACGLPIISSKRDFNLDILDDSNSILIDPEDIDAIAKAINMVKSTPRLMETLSQGSLRKSEELTIEKRALKITEFMKNCINDYAK